MSIAKEGLKFILPSAALACALGAVGWWLGSILLLALVLAFLFFFRDPRRTPPAGENLLDSPADGKVLAVDSLPSHPDFTGPVNRVTIFLSLLDVHLVRSPFAATVGRVEYHAGKFLPAYRPEASTANESNTLVLKGVKTTLVMKQIVGVAARRIKCYVKEGQSVARGEKVGLMYFGSRVEITLPREPVLKVSLNQKVKAGESVIAEVQP
jgi:phosphatidylserine decarboxylase